MSKRIITDSINVNENIVTVTKDALYHINALRYNVKDRLYINEYEVEITYISKDKLVGKIVGDLKEKGKPIINITLVQGFLKKDNMEYVVQKAVELGVKQIIPTVTKNTVVKLDDKDKQKKKERFDKIVKEAVEQCGRTDSVEIHLTKKLNEVDFSNFDIIFVCHEKSTNTLKETITKIKENYIKEKKETKNICVIIGPEGGLEESEIKNIVALKNAYLVLLGDRILRAETASLNILSILMYEFDKK